MKIITLTLLVILSCFAETAMAQTELMPWGNIRGIRVNGQLMEFETSLRVGGKEMTRATGKERQRPKYERKNGGQVVTTAIGQLDFMETVRDGGTGSAAVMVEVTAKEVTEDGIYFCVTLPGKWYGKAVLQADGLPAKAITAGIAGTAGKIGFRAAGRSLTIHLSKPSAFRIQQNKNGNFELYLPIHEGRLEKGGTASLSLTLLTSGTADTSLVHVTIETANEGRAFDGFGGNFRLQNAATDPQVIDYCLQNMRLAWGRVEMPWRFWQVKKTGNPLDSAHAGKLHPQVQRAMEMAQRLGKMGMPVILSAWSPPAWAVIGEPRFAPTPEGVWGNPLDTASMEAIYRSIGDYIQFVKEHYGVEIAMFSFNESDLGINIRQTGEEHAAFIKGMGAHLQQRGLSTKLLLGDNSDANSYQFIYPAMNDAAALPYIGAVSFHSWRGWDERTLQKWADAAAKLRLPLLVAEGSIDAQAWGYPQVFLEETYAREEINLYTRLLNICQPASILQWQLTADYSVMAGGGIFGDRSPLRPTQRFWNLKQLSSAPAGLKALKVTSDKEDVTIAALGDHQKGQYVIHLVNNGATRKTIIEGLPRNVRSLKVIVTDKTRNMQEEKPATVKNGRAELELGATTYTTLMAE
ncbi:hypothetical protein ACFOTA_15270 [Chitinophaga sp. GCM10012297]|uniref:O-Glycosyl hydrolase n=1 Tax=Chitinophaga chungangae TaxID=2821488 RepID=A0ABS3YGJ8_9BACT|nr:hypothetical protein [Chitinophaga chungangae]MBO9153580.1 hypothetical protein [Chitinophaga chungangae]